MSARRWISSTGPASFMADKCCSPAVRRPWSPTKTCAGCIWVKASRFESINVAGLRMALGPRLDIRQSQSLVMTPQLQQAIKLLALSNLEIETFIGEAIESNPLLEIDQAGPAAATDSEPDQRRTSLENSPCDQLIGEGRGAEDRPLDIDAGALDIDRDTGDAAAGNTDSASFGSSDGESSTYPGAAFEGQA